MHIVIPRYCCSFETCSLLIQAVDVMMGHPEDLWPFIWDCCCILFLVVSTGHWLRSKDRPCPNIF